MAQLNQKHKSHEMGLHEEKLTGRTRRAFFSAQEEENLVDPSACEVDFNKQASFDAAQMTHREVGLRIRQLMEQGYGHIVVQNPNAKHSLGICILNRLKLDFEGSLGYFAAGLVDGPNITIKGRVGWSCGENMLSGTVVVEKNAGSSFGAAIRGGDLVCRRDAGARTGISMKSGTIIVGGRSGILSGFMMQRGRIIILGDVGASLGDSMYDGTIYVGGKIESLGTDAVPGELTELEVTWLERKLALYGLEAPDGVSNLHKIVAGKQLWNYDNLEPAEKKIVL